MALEGLQIILEKEPVVSTPTADRLRSAPEMVEAAFLRHVRSYLPLGRVGGADADQVSIADYEARLIDLVKQGRAPKGYVTAEYGYGKTSTALYLWDRCRKADLLAVPPFQLNALEDLIHASHGWARYEIDRRAPSLVPRVDALYREYVERSIEAIAAGNDDTADLLRDLVERGSLSLSLSAPDYVDYFARLEAIAAEVGFQGLVVLPDEVQQYVEPSIRAGRGDPIAPLHNVVEAMSTRKGNLRVGIVFSIPFKELGVINDQRGDLVQRLKADRLGLDLSTIYDKHFALRLWKRLAEEFALRSEADRVVTDSALRALGQIAARDDLANGPRTVTAAFVHVARRFLDGEGRVDPLDPIGLVDAFLAGEIPFDGTSKLQRVINQHLENPVVAARPAFRPVVKLLAAFPTDGATEDTLLAAGLAAETDELQRLAQGDIVVGVGGGRDNRGQEVPYGRTLRGLEPASSVASDWLTSTIREFARGYVLQAGITLDRAERSFARLLTRLVFREPHWKEVERTERRRTDASPTTILFRGSFGSTLKRFPDRRILARVLRDGDRAPAPAGDVDVTLDFVLRLHLDVDDRERRQLPGELAILAPNHARLSLNLLHQPSEQFYPDLQAKLQPVVSPYQVTPLLMLALDETLDEKRRAHLIPKEDDNDVGQIFQPSLLGHSADEFFNAEVGTTVDARGERVVEAVVRQLCEQRYPTYRTIIVQQAWANALRDYQTALERLANRYERQGEADVTGTKEEVARLFNRSNPAFDSLLLSFPDLFKVTTPFKGKERGALRFELHPFEAFARDHIRSSDRTASVVKSGQRFDVHVADLGQIQQAGRDQGYRDEEIAAFLDLMRVRELVEIVPRTGTIREVAHPALRREDLVAQLDRTAQRQQALLAIYPDEPMLTTQATYVQTWRQQVEKTSFTVDDPTIAKLANNLRLFDRELATFVRTKTEALQAGARAIAQATSVDLHAAHALHETVTGPLFADQLDAVRTTLLKAADELAARRAEVKERAFGLLSDLGVDESTDELLVRGYRDLAELRQAAKANDGKSEEVAQRCVNLTTARRALNQATALEVRLRMGEGKDESLAQDFASLVTQVRQELSSHKTTAIDRAATWESDVVAIEARRTEGLVKLQQQFDLRKAHLLDLLQRFANLPAGRDPFSVTFNPLDPTGSTRQLSVRVSEVMATSIDGIAGLLAGWTATLHQLLASGDLAYIGDAGGTEQRARTLLAEVGERHAAAKAIRGQVTDLEIVGEASDDGRFVALLRAFAVLATDVARLGQEQQAIRAALKPVQLTPAEADLLHAIEPLVAANGATIEVGTLLHGRGVVDATGADDVWRLLRGLYDKRRVRLHLAPLRHD